jgi:hypothetical protein
VTLRSMATIGLAGIAVVQAVGLPSVVEQGGRFAVLSGAAMAACLALRFALAAAPAAAGGPVWLMVAVAAVAVLAGWALPHAVDVPGLEEARGDWASAPRPRCGASAASRCCRSSSSRSPGWPGWPGSSRPRHSC